MNRRNFLVALAGAPVAAVIIPRVTSASVVAPVVEIPAQPKSTLHAMTRAIVRATADRYGRPVTFNAGDKIGRDGLTRQLKYVFDDDRKINTEPVVDYFVASMRATSVSLVGSLPLNFAGCESTCACYNGVMVRGLRQYQIQTDTYSVHFDMIVG